MININDITPTHKNVLVKNMEFGERKIGSIIISDDDMKEIGIRPRWAEIVSFGPETDNLKDYKYVLIDHGRWTHGFDVVNDGNEKITVRFIDYKDILMVSNIQPTEYQQSRKK